jgi:hypothetical protein
MFCVHQIHQVPNLLTSVIVWFPCYPVCDTIFYM